MKRKSSAIGPHLSFHLQEEFSSAFGSIFVRDFVESGLENIFVKKLSAENINLSHI